jgi:hypothetical protein
MQYLLLGVLGVLGVLGRKPRCLPEIQVSSEDMLSNTLSRKDTTVVNLTGLVQVLVPTPNLFGMLHTI